MYVCMYCIYIYIYIYIYVYVYVYICICICILYYTCKYLIYIYIYFCNTVTMAVCNYRQLHGSSNLSSEKSRSLNRYAIYRLQPQLT